MCVCLCVCVCRGLPPPMALRAQAHVEVMLAHKVVVEEVCSAVMVMLEEFVGRCLCTHVCVCVTFVYVCVCE